VFLNFTAQSLYFQKTLFSLIISRFFGILFDMLFIVIVSLLSLIAPIRVSAQTVPDPNSEVAAKVSTVFAAMPEMIAVAKCESNMRQFTKEGAVLHGGTGGAYVGIFQISEALHAERALKMGHDIMTIDGNIGYALWLRTTQGVAPWKGCVPATATLVAGVVASAVVSGDTLTKVLKIGVRDTQVMMLQKKLNASGFAIASSGPGSMGNETDYFGAMTRDAVKKFQCAKGIVCEGTESTTGFGRIGPRTREMLNVIVLQ
jgi:hypothetical protein